MSKRGRGEGGITKRSDGRYVARLVYVDDRGEKHRASAYAKSEKEARTKLREMQRRVEDHAPVRESTATVAAWSERWLAVSLPASSRKATTKETYARLVRTHVIPRTIGSMRLDRLAPSDVEAWITDLGERLSPSSCRQAHAILCMILDGAEREGMVRRNVARLVGRPRRPAKEAPTYTSEEVGRLLDAADGDRLAPFLTLVAFTGLRKGEALGLRWSDVDLDRGTLRVSGTLVRLQDGLTRVEPKTAKGRRTVPLVEQAVAALQQARKAQRLDRLAAGPAWEDTGYVFTTEVGTPVDPRNALRWFYSVRGAAKMKTGSLHTLRHAAASVMLANGVPMPIVSDVLGHSSIQITVDMYGHMAPSIVADEVRRGLAGYGRA